MLLNGIPHPIAYAGDSISPSDPNRVRLTCPASGQLMRNPVIASDGITYDYDAIIRRYLKEQTPASPVYPSIVLAGVETLRPDWESRKRLMRMIRSSR